MNLLKTGIDFTRGVGNAHYNQLMREGARDANLGLNHSFSFIFHYALIENTCDKVNEVLQNIQFATISPISPFIRCYISLSIPLSLIFTKLFINFTNHPNIHTIITTLDNHVLPSVILVTNLVASVALMAFGNPVYGGANLAFLLLNLIHEKGWMDTDFIQKNTVFNCMLDMCVITKCVHSLFIKHSLNPLHIWVLADTIYEAINSVRKTTDLKITPIALQEYISKYPESTTIRYRLNEYHLLKDFISSNPLEDLTSQFDHYTLLLGEYLEQDLSSHKSELLHLFRNDDHWMKNPKENPIDYLKKGINSFLNSIKISHNAEFKNKSLSIIRYIFTLPKDAQIDLIAKLAITGHYCPERLSIDTKLLYDTYIDALESRELSNKIVHVLHQERLQLVDQNLAWLNMLHTTQHLYNSQSVSARLLKILSPERPLMEDVHFANIIKNLICPYLYIHHKSIDVLSQVNTKNLSWLAVNWFYKKQGFIPLIESAFAKEYNPKRVLERIDNIITHEPTIQDREIQQWFVEQYMSNHSKATRDEAAAWVREQVYACDDNYIPRVKPYYLLFFLVNQGVLKIEDSSDDKTRATDIIDELPPTPIIQEERVCNS